MNAVKMIFTGISMSLYSTYLLKVYLDIFLVKRSGCTRVVGWLLFFLWQICINTEIVFFHPVINLIMTLMSILSVGIISYEGIFLEAVFISFNIRDDVDAFGRDSRSCLFISE